VTVRVADRRWFHRTYPAVLSVWLPLRRTLDAAAARNPALQEPIMRGRESAKRWLGFDRTPDTRMQGGSEPLPAWLEADWLDIRDIDPDVLPVGLETDRVPVYRYEVKSPMIDAYERICALTPPGVTHVITMPWLLTGGSDLEALNYVRALHESGKTGAIVVVASADAASPWAARLPAGVTFINLGRIARKLVGTEQEFLLATYLVQLRPRVIHNINSDLAYRVLSHHGAALRAVGARIFLSLFCYDYSPEGLTDGYQVRYLREVSPYVDGIFCDNAHHLDEITELFALDPATLHVHEHPMEIVTPGARRPEPSGSRLRVLWAGRLDRQKRPDLLLEIAARVEHLPLDIDVYGAAVLDRKGTLLDRMEAAPNINYRGGFDGFSSLPTPLYDLLLYTSQWDGMPNVPLEATAYGLPVIASNIGGISEFLQDGVTGRLVTPYDDVDGYVTCLADACRNPTQLQELRDAAQRVMTERRSFARFADTLDDVPGYVDSVG